MTFKAKYNSIRNDEEVVRWYRNLQQGSLITGDIYLRTLGLYCSLRKTNPKRIIEDAKTGKLRKDFMDFVYSMRKKGKAGSYIIRFKKVINSWCLFNGYDGGLKGIKIQGSNISPTLIDERPPSSTEIDTMLRNATVRGRAIISLLAFSGLRPESLGNYDGSDALKIKDVEGLKVASDGVEFTMIPAVLKVRQSKVQLSKKGHRYFTFVAGQTSKYLTDYLNLRIRSGESIGPESPIITTDTRGSQKKRNGILATAFLLRDVRDAVMASGLKFRPYALRVYFSSALDVCEAKGLVSHNWREFWFGHVGDISARYSTNKVLPKDTIEEMRETFRKCTKYIEIEHQGITEDQSEKRAKEVMLTIAGFTKDEIERENLLELSAEELGKKVRERLLGAMINNGNRQKVVTVTEVESFINKGWEFVTILPGDRSIVKFPDKV